MRPLRYGQSYLASRLSAPTKEECSALNRRERRPERPRPQRRNDARSWRPPLSALAPIPAPAQGPQTNRNETSDLVKSHFALGAETSDLVRGLLRPGLGSRNI